MRIEIKFVHFIRSLSILLACLTCLLMIMGLLMQHSPVEEYMEYEKILSSFGDPVAITENKENILLAEHFRKAALEEWNSQESRFFLLRNYNESKRMMNIAITLIEDASEQQPASDHLPRGPYLSPP